MIWNSFLFNKTNKWLSYNLWFTYIHLYKVLFFFNFTILKNCKILYKFKQNKLNLYRNNSKTNFLLNKTKVRFSYYIDLYCVEFLNQLILLNLYFLTNLYFYKNSDDNKDVDDTYFFNDDEFFQNEEEDTVDNNQEFQVSSNFFNNNKDFMYLNFF